MGKSKTKKPFINKKNASTYHLMHRSQRDVAGDIMAFNNSNDDDDDVPISSTGMVLWPGENNLPETNKKVLFSTTTIASSISYNNDVEETTSNTTTNKKKKDDDNTTAKKDTHSSMKEWRMKLEAVGLLEDDEEYDKYLKPITGTGTYLDAKSGQAVDIKKVLLNGSRQQQPAKYEEDAIMEVDRVFDSIPLTMNCMDPDIAAALFTDDLEECDYEELNDDFVFMAAQEPDDIDIIKNDDDEQQQQQENNNNNNATTFDYDEHIRRLLEKASRNDTTSTTNNAATAANHNHADIHYFSNMKALHEHKDDDDDSWENHNNHYDNDHDEMMTTSSTIIMPGVVPKLNPDEERALCEKFEMTLAEYDESDNDEYENVQEEDDRHHHNIGEETDSNDNNHNNNHNNNRPLEGDAYIDAALDEYLQEKNDDVYIQGIPKDRTKGTVSSFINNNNVGGLSSSEPIIPVDILLAEATQRLNEPIVKPPAEDILFDGKSYFSHRERNPWDCESILTTYSNLDNNPTTISGGTSRRKKKIKQQQLIQNKNEEDEDVIQPILLSSKTGLPIGVLPTRQQQDTNKINNKNNNDHHSRTGSTIVSLYKREKDETLEEKKTRKLIIKQDRTMARIQKKVTKEVYQNEYQKKVSVPMEDIGGKTVFRYS